MHLIIILRALHDDGLALQGDALVVCYLQHARSKLQLHSLDSGHLQSEIPLPGLGSVREFAGRRKDDEAFFLYTDFAVPGAIYRCTHITHLSSRLLPCMDSRMAIVGPALCAGPGCLARVQAIWAAAQQ